MGQMISVCQQAKQSTIRTNSPQTGTRKISTMITLDSPDHFGFFRTTGHTPISTSYFQRSVRTFRTRIGKKRMSQTFRSDLDSVMTKSATPQTRKTVEDLSSVLTSIVTALGSNYHTRLFSKPISSSKRHPVGFR